jgi:transcription elongation factor GreA|uniref:Transcription elongation factor GreA n=1 Tax=candidate division WOR-3 bacterium TaxID=2052148 RepID=A0A7V3VUS9_UNCW3
MVEKARELVKNKDFAALEALWIEMMEDANISISDFLKIANELKGIKETKQAFTLLEILASHLEDENRLDEAIEVYKNIAYFTDDDTSVRTKLVKIYKKRYSNNERIEKFIELSGIEKGEHLFKSLDRLEEFLKFDVGRVVYFEKYGLGEVVVMNPEKREIVVDFEKQKGYFLKFDVARGILKPVPEGHYLYKKYRGIEELKKLASEDPFTLVRYLLKSFKEPMSSSEIKTHLEGVISKEEVDKFWEKVRKKLEKDDNVKVEIKKGMKVYQLIEGVDKNILYLESFKEASIGDKYLIAERCAKDSPEVFNEMLNSLVLIANEKYREEPAIALDILYLCEEYKKTGLNYTIDELLEFQTYEFFLANLKNFEHKKKFLKEIKNREPNEWEKTYLRMMSTVEDLRLIDLMEEELKNSNFNLSEFYRSLFLMPQKSTGLFLWLLKNIGEGEFKEILIPKYLPRLINNLNDIKGARTAFLKAFSLERFDEIIKGAEVSDVLKIKEELIKSTALKAYEKKDYLRIIDYHYPNLEKKDDFIYATPQALEKKKAELEHLLKVEIPKNKEEISKAREYGDLRENFEYKAARERQSQLYQRVRMIESELKRVKLIDFNNLDTSRVSIGTKVILKNLEDGKVIEYTILGPWDSDLSRNIISHESPLAKNILMNKKVGDKVEIQEKIYEVIRIEPAEV